jgi:transcription elongation factor GreA
MTIDRPVYVTANGLAELEAELEELRNEKLPTITAELHEAKLGSDWMDNSEHMLLEDELAFLEVRIQELEDMLANARLIRSHAGSSIVEVGSTVVMAVDEEEPETYTIVGVAETDPGRGWISNECPLGKAVLGHKVGDVVTVKAPSGDWEVRIISVEQMKFG